MISIYRLRHYCEFCKKSGCRKDIIARHEAGCTMNPARVCGCCRLAGRRQPSMQELFEASRRDSEQFGEWEETPGGDEIRLIRRADNLMAVVDSGVEGIGGCPACILATIRQFPGGSYVLDFDFKDAMKLWLDEFGTPRDMSH